MADDDRSGMAVTFPLAQTVQHKVYAGETRDERGNVTDTWDDPVEVSVIGWYVSSTHEPQIAGHDRVLVDAQVLVPEGFAAGTQDRFVLPGKGEFEVTGETEDYNHGPFGWRPGGVVNLRRVTG